MKKIQIHGKDYVMVKDRIIYFNDNYPNGSITTELIEMTDKFIVKATIVPDVLENPDRIFTGHAEEVIGSSQINKTSALENCETSAIGRALGCLGIGVEDAFASADEVKNAQHQQNNPIYIKTRQELADFDELLKHDYFKGKRALVKEQWKKTNTISETTLFLKQMKERTQQEQGELQ